jgi:tRNA(fMet)-specific endonuclease VapC
MIVLDTDHITELQIPESASGRVLRERLDESLDQDIVTTIVTVEERLRGRLAPLARQPKQASHVEEYEPLEGLVNFYRNFRVLSFDSPAATRFSELRSLKREVGSMDLKIASIVLVRGALLLTSNLRHFSKVPGLKVRRLAS